MFLHEALIQFEHHRAGVPVGQVRDAGLIAQPAQRGEIGIGPDVFAEGHGHGIVDGLDGPLPGDVDRLQRAVRTGAHHHRRPVGRPGGVLDDLPAAVDPGAVIGMGLIGLQQGELGVVAEVHAFVAERPAQFEHPLDPADAQPLEVQLRRDPQVQVQVVGVDVGLERPGVGPAVDALQDRGLDLQETLGEQSLPNGAQDVTAGADEIAGNRIDRQVDVAGPHPGLRVGQPLPLVGQRSQTFAEHAPAGDQHRPGSVAAVPHPAGDLDEIAEIHQGEVVRIGVQRRCVEQQLHVTRPVPQGGEGDAAVVAGAQHAARHHDGGAVAVGQRRSHSVGRRPPDRVGVHAAVLESL